MYIPGRLAYDLLAGPGLFGNKNKEISFHTGRAPQPKTLFSLVFIYEFPFLLLPRADIGHPGFNVEFFKMTFFNSNFAFSAYLFLSA